ncbi:MAG: hypothetical protein PWQ95_2058 [Thermococcaceae archaeon]|nr:hypothetical protein [Thermococcaceae archaeon]
MKVDLRTEKNMGLIGSILSLVGGLLGSVPYVGVLFSLVSLVGFVLLLVALKGIGDKLGDDRPFRYLLYSVIALIGGLVLFIILAVAGIISLAALEGEGGEVFALGIVIFGLLLFLAVLVVAVYFEIQAWRATYEITGVEEFNQVATFLKWGAITLIILVGAILLLVAQIFQIIAFSKLPEEMEVGGGEELQEGALVY